VRRAIEATEPVRMLVVAVDADESQLRDVLDWAEAAHVESNVAMRRVSRRELRRMAGPGEDVDVIALVGPDPQATLAEMFDRPGPVWLLAGPSYPGNAGLATRAAEVSGAAGVCIDAEFDRAGRRACLRASMRSDRIMPVHFMPWPAVVEEARRSGRLVVAIEDVGERLPWQADLRVPSLLVVGGEAEGVPEALLALADTRLRLPTGGFVSSYNLQTAMAAVMAELLRQSHAPTS
jgi:tRNA G18 (ribose-2'-O)-methylase SpoU